VLTARQLSNLTINYSSGSFPHWYSAPEGHTQDYLPKLMLSPRASAQRGDSRPSSDHSRDRHNVTGPFHFALSCSIEFP
jgi:hypothetical protein